MGFLDKAKEKATTLTQQAKEKIDDVKDNRKADDLLADLGRISYRRQTARGTADDDAVTADLVAQLQALESEGTDVLKTTNAAAATSSVDVPPPPPPMAPPGSTPGFA